jgi:hypothetical protein
MNLIAFSDHKVTQIDRIVRKLSLMQVNDLEYDLAREELQ